MPSIRNTKKGLKLIHLTLYDLINHSFKKHLITCILIGDS